MAGINRSAQRNSHTSVTMETVAASCRMIGAPHNACQPKLGVVVPRLASKGIRGNSVVTKSGLKRSAKRVALDVCAAAAAPAVETPNEVRSRTKRAA